MKKQDAIKILSTRLGSNKKAKLFLILAKEIGMLPPLVTKKIVKERIIDEETIVKIPMEIQVNEWEEK